MNQLIVNNLSYSIGNKEILNNLTFNCSAGEVIAIIGKNGIGKTTLLKNILKKLNKVSSIKLIGTEPIIGYVPQFRQIDEELPLSVEDFISLPLTKSFLPWLTNKEKQAINYVLNLTNSTLQKSKSLGLLSGGERQRIYLAQALVNKPNMLLLDEFTSNLDKDSEIECMSLIREITKKENIITLCITHELSLIDEQYVDKILYLSDEGFKFINVKDFNDNSSSFKFCKHYVGEK